MNDPGAHEGVPVGLGPEQFGEAFPFHFTAGSDLRLGQCGHAFRRLCDGQERAARLDDLVEVVRPVPDGPMDFASLLALRRMLVMLRHRATGTLLRGQFLPVADQPAVVFLGSPWITDPDQLGAAGLDLADFSVHDPIVDLLHVLQTQKVALQDVRRLADRLSLQRSELRIANERLRQQEAEQRKLALVAARTDNAVVLTDAAGRIEWVNEGFTRMTGYALAEVLGRTPGSVLQGPGTNPRTVEFMRQALARGEGFSTEVINYGKDGRKYWISIEVQPVRDEAGRITNFMAIESDVSDRRRAFQRRTLQYEISRGLGDADTVDTGLATILGAIGSTLEWEFGAFWAVDEDGASAVCRKVWSRPGTEVDALVTASRDHTSGPGEGLPGKVWQAGTPHWVRDFADEPDLPRNRVALGCGFHSGFAFPLSQGAVVWGIIEFYSLQIEEPDLDLLRLFAAVGSQISQFRDRLGARRQAQDALHLAKDAAEAANRSKSDFLAMMSHEIRTPMNSILGMAEFLRETPLESRQLEFVDSIRVGGEALLEIINDILDFSKIESERLTLFEEDFELEEFLGKIVDLFAHRAGSRGLELALILRPEVPRLLRADDGRLRQILVNLVGNAIKFTERGEVVLRVESEPPTPTHAILRFTVSDTGIGIRAEDLPRLFQPFSQVDGSSARRYGGTGLGLAISRRLVELMGGTITAASHPGVGSSFSFTCCLATRAVPPAPTHPGLDHVRALVVSPSPHTRESITLQLAAWGIPSEALPDPHDLVGRLRSVSAGDPLVRVVVLLDGRSGGDDVRPAAGTIRADAELFASRLVLLTPVGANPSTKDAGIDLFDDRLPYPCKPSSLLVRLFAQTAPSAQDTPMLPTPPVPDDSDPPPGIARYPLRILVAEDHEINRRLALLMLEKLGYQAEFVVNGREAIEALARRPFDLVLMDCQMPEMDGLAATRAIRREEAGRPGAPVHIVAMTANAMRGDREICLAAGMDDYLSKPVKLDALGEAIAAAARKLAPAPAPAPVFAFASSPAAPAEKVTTASLAALERGLGELVSEFGPEAAVELIESFLNDTPDRLAELTHLTDSADASPIARVAHSIAGSSGIFGLEELRQLGLRIEDSIRAARMDEAHRLIEELRGNYARTAPEIRRHLARIRSSI